MVYQFVYFLFFNFCHLLIKFKNFSKLRTLDFNSFPSEKLDILKHLENGILRNTIINKQRNELKIRGNKNLIIALNSFSWLIFLSSINNHKARKDTEYLFRKSNILELNFSYPVWKPSISALRLLAISLNVNFLKLTNSFTKKNELYEFIRFHFLYLNYCKLFESKGLSSLRINMAIFFSSFLICELNLKRYKILKDIIKDLNYIIDNSGNIKTRNSSDLLEILFFINRALNFSSTSDLSKGIIVEELEKFKNIICPILKGLRLGNGILSRSCNSSGLSVYCELEKELSDANPTDLSVNKNPIDFIRINSGRLLFLFDKKAGIQKEDSNDYICPSFSFEMTSGENIILQNNTSFFCHLGSSNEILFLKNQLNTLGLNIENDNEKYVKFISNSKEVNHYRDLKYNYLEGNKSISFDNNKILFCRKLVIPFSGNSITGKEILNLNEVERIKNNLIFIPFYFHPDVDIWKADQESKFLLRLKNNEMWRFETDQKNIIFEQYDFLDPKDLEIKKGYKIVLPNKFSKKEIVINWKLYLQNISPRVKKRI